MKARVSPVQWSKPHSILAATQDSNPGGRIQNDKRWPLPLHIALYSLLNIRLHILNVSIAHKMNRIWRSNYKLVYPQCIRLCKVNSSSGYQSAVDVARLSSDVTEREIWDDHVRFVGIAGSDVESCLPPSLSKSSAWNGKVVQRKIRDTAWDTWNSVRYVIQREIRDTAWDKYVIPRRYVIPR